jgi:hypothetical protein
MAGAPPSTQLDIQKLIVHLLLTVILVAEAKRAKSKASTGSSCWSKAGQGISNETIASAASMHDGRLPN